jgi:hypothetical protein
MTNDEALERLKELTVNHGKVIQSLIDRVNLHTKQMEELHKLILKQEVRLSLVEREKPKIIL